MTRKDFRERFEQVKANEEGDDSVDFELRCVLQTPPFCKRCSDKDGKPLGYLISSAGSLAKATICDCVLTCPQCHGKCLKLVSNKAQRCVDFPPSFLVGLFNLAQIPTRYVSAHLLDFKTSKLSILENGKERPLYDEISNWLKNFDLWKSRGFVFAGGIGIGKTYLLVAMMRQLIYRYGKTCLYLDTQDLIYKLRASFQESKSDTEASILNSTFGVDILFIDELGKGRMTPYEQSIIDQIINRRYNANKMVIAATNYKTEWTDKTAIDPNRKLDEDDDPNHYSRIYLQHKIGERCYSRLLEICEIRHLTGQNQRLLAQRSH